MTSGSWRSSERRPDAKSNIGWDEIAGAEHNLLLTHAERVAAALLERQNDTHVMTDINSCCEYLNTRHFVKKNIHGVVGYGMGGSYALQFACQRKRLRAAVSSAVFNPLLSSG